MFLRVLVVFLENVLDDNFLQALRRDAALVGSLLLSAGLGRENGTNKHTQSWIVHVVKFVFAHG